MTEKLFMKDAYMKAAEGKVMAHTEQGSFVLDRSIFTPQAVGKWAIRAA